MTAKKLIQVTSLAAKLIMNLRALRTPPPPPHPPAVSASRHGNILQGQINILYVLKKNQMFTFEQSVHLLMKALSPPSGQFGNLLTYTVILLSLWAVSYCVLGEVALPGKVDQVDSDRHTKIKTPSIYSC